MRVVGAMRARSWDLDVWGGIAVIVVASSNGRVGIKQAVEVLRQGGSAIDAVVAAQWTAAGLAAHESAMSGGAVVEIPSFADEGMAQT